MILVTGFGPFQDVTDNPSATLVRSLHGQAIRGQRIVGVVLPVAWRAVPERVLHWADRLQPTLILGTGVARTRQRVEVERIARPVATGRDVHGCEGPGTLGEAVRHPTVDPERLARALGAYTSDDAGAYLCNAWLYEVPAKAAAPAAFIHIPPEGLAPERMLRALQELTRAR